MRYAFYISGKSNRLLHFLEQAKEEVYRQISVIVSDDLLTEEFCQKLTDYQMQVKIIDYKKLNSATNEGKNTELSDKMLEIFEQYRIDYCFSFGAHILSGKLLRRYKNKMINFHPAILPMFPGRKAIDQAVNAGNVFLVGNTAHFIDSGVDTGMIIMQSVIPLQSFFDSATEYDVILDLQIDMLNQLIDILNRQCLVVKENRVRIIGADYNYSSIYPLWSKAPESVHNK